MDASKEEEKFKEIVKSREAEMKCVPNWLIEVFEWIKRTEMADSQLSISCLAFKQLCWPKLHGRVKPFKISKLKFWPERRDGNVRAKLLRIKIKEGKRGVVKHKELIPIADISPPEYILGVEKIVFCFLNVQIMQFMGVILPLINGIYIVEVRAQLDHEPQQRYAPLMHKFFGFFNDVKIFGLDLRNSTFYYFDWQFPDLILINPINFLSLSMYDFEYSLLDWLTNQWNIERNGNQRIVEIEINNDLEFEFIGRIIQKFLSATQPSNFLIIAIFDGNFNEFTLENERTDEILTFYNGQNQDGNDDENEKFIIARYPKGEDHWKDEGERKYRQFMQKPYSNTRLVMDINSEDILDVGENFEEQSREHIESADVQPEQISQAAERRAYFISTPSIIILAFLLLKAIYLFCMNLFK